MNLLRQFLFVVLLAATTSAAARGITPADAAGIHRQMAQLGLPAELGVSADAKECCARFGGSVDVDGDTAVIGAPGAFGYGGAYVFVRSGGTWTLQQTLFVTAPLGAEGDSFGAAVAVSGDRVIVGAPGEDNRPIVGGFQDRGAAYVFTRSGEHWQQTDRFLGGYGQHQQRFGSSVALDGDTAMIGSPGGLSSYNGGQQSGSVTALHFDGASWVKEGVLTAQYPGNFNGTVALHGDVAVFGTDGVGAEVFARSNGTWSRQQQLVAGSQSEVLSVALSHDWILLSFLRDGASGPGSTWGFHLEDGSWIERREFAVEAPPGGSDYASSVAVSTDSALVTGYAGTHLYALSGDAWTEQPALSATCAPAATGVALDGTTAMIGAGSDDTGRQDTGLACIFAGDATTWTEQARLSTDDGFDHDALGGSMAISGTTALIGAAGDDTAVAEGAGSAYVFELKDGVWTRQALLIADDGVAGEVFGAWVALSGDTALIGSFSAVYVFVRNGGVWTRQARIPLAGIQDVAIEGDLALVGTPYEGAYSGTVHTFVRSGTTWTEGPTLTAGDGEFRSFGRGLAIQGDTVLIGAEDYGGGSLRTGAVYVFHHDGDDWTQVQRLLPSTVNTRRFGHDIALDGATALVGAPDNSEAFVFTRAGGAWRQQARLVASDRSGSIFGTAVALRDNVAVIGAPAPSRRTASETYLFTRSGSLWGERAHVVLPWTVLGDPPYAVGDRFGSSVALCEGMFLAGAPSRATPPPGDATAGAVYAYPIAADFGDAPDPYPTTVAHDGARHLLDTDGPRLGAYIDAEPDAATSSGATGDDIAGNADEDGVSFGPLFAGFDANAGITVSGAPGVLDGWIDFNGDGDWSDAGERVFRHVAVGIGDSVVPFKVPGAAHGGSTVARLRLSSAGVGAPTGLATDGEVEDHAVGVTISDNPDPFHFTDLTGAASLTTLYSDVVRLAGLTGPSHIDITGDASAALSINGGPYVTGAAVVANGDRIRVRLKSPAAENAAATATVTVTRVSDSFTVTTGHDTMPLRFAFADRAGVPAQAGIASNVITLAGLNAPAPVILRGDALVSHNGGAFGPAPATVANGDRIQLRVLSAHDVGASVEARFNVGGIGDVFTVTTGSDAVPRAFAFTDVAAAAAGSIVTSNRIRIAAMNTAATVTLTGPALVSVNDGPFASPPARLNDGDAVRLRVVASGSAGQTVTSTLDVGGVSDSWDVTTAP
jgi:hypothetical protein